MDSETVLSCFSVVSHQAPLAARVSLSLLVVASQEVLLRTSRVARIFVARVDFDGRPLVDINATPHYHPTSTHWSSSTVLGDTCVPLIVV